MIGYIRINSLPAKRINKYQIPWRAMALEQKLKLAGAKKIIAAVARRPLSLERFKKFVSEKSTVYIWDYRQVASSYIQWLEFNASYNFKIINIRAEDPETYYKKHKEYYLLKTKMDRELFKSTLQAKKTVEAEKNTYRFEKPPLTYIYNLEDKSVEVSNFEYLKDVKKYSDTSVTKILGKAKSILSSAHKKPIVLKNRKKKKKIKREN